MERYPPLWSWALGTVRLTVQQGSLLDAAEQAWVNSEQTDFMLASGGFSVSAQLLRAWPIAQAELNAQTKGQDLPPGTVLETSGPDGRRIYHAGFHEWNIWLLEGDEDATIHLEHIQSCVEQILTRVGDSALESVAFPLIGTGNFGLPVERVASLFFEAVARYGMRAARPLNVALYVWEPADLGCVVQEGTRTLASLIAGGPPLLSGDGGHPLLGSLRKAVRSSANAEVEVRALLRFSEFALATDLATLADHGSLDPAAFLRPSVRDRGGCKMTFGLVFNQISRVCKVVRGLPDHLEERRLFLRDASTRERIGDLVRDRNAYAHHRDTRPSSEIKDDVDALFGAQALPHPWPARDGRWARREPDGFALLYGVDFIRGVETWLAPETRRYWDEHPQ